ncbi:DUF6171 family protein [Anaerosporobacter faecicola]|uniref:DUF6171 family protein n=1 Tax=Anaerosporobacter faecicola TaxID=2718714 RepID=UPI001438E30B|nr:DUF6171 family protein [Anaerosporobacter faecicola]
MKMCKRCLLSEIDQDQYYANMYEYIALLPVDIKTEEKEYQRRLSLCKQCDELQNGMCRKCGCFVEVRAAKKQNYCPSEKKFW